MTIRRRRILIRDKVSWEGLNVRRRVLRRQRRRPARRRLLLVLLRRIQHPRRRRKKYHRHPPDGNCGNRKFQPPGYGIGNGSKKHTSHRNNKTRALLSFSTIHSRNSAAA